jgi:hypothetical protein
MIAPVSRPDTRVSIVTTVRDPDAPLLSFVRYHLSIGFRHIYLFFDDPHDPLLTLADGLPGVTAIRCDTALLDWQRANVPSFERLWPFYHREVMARQILNADVAIHLAIADQADWLLHIDIDELFYCDRPVADHAPAARHFGAIPQTVGQVVYLNYEGFPETTDVADYFREVTLFKKNPHLCAPEQVAEWLARTGRDWYFVAYRNGKAAVRLQPGVSTDGVHVFDIAKTGGETIHIANPYVLHYPNCGLARFIRKYQYRGAFSATSFDRWPRLPCHLASRDVVLRGEQEEIREFFDRHMRCRNADEADSLVEAGLGQRITAPRDLVERGGTIVAT